MKIPYHELNPRPYEFEMEGKAYKLAPFSLKAQTWAYEEFKTEQEPNGLKNLSELLKAVDLKTAVVCCWYLLEDKKGLNIGEFFEICQKHENIRKPFDALAKTIGLSQPHIEGIEEELELKKFKAVKAA